MKCYIDDEECDCAGDDECLAVFPEQCRLHELGEEWIGYE